MATYTAIADVDLEAVSRIYGLDELTLGPLSGGAANSSFRADATQGRFVLTVLDNHDPPSARRLAAHTRTLFQRGIPTTEVLLTRSGEAVAHIGGSPVLVKRWVEGEVRDPLPDRHLRQVGRVLAQVHTLAPDLPGVPHRTRRLSEHQRGTVAEFADTAFAGWLSTRLERVLNREADATSTLVLSHGDLFADNIVVRPDGELVILDWETLCVDSPLLDLGMAVLGTAQQQGRIPARRAALVVSGYEDARPLHDQERVAIPAAVEHAALIIAFHRYYRHNVRYPDPAKATLHEEIVAMVDNLSDSLAGWPE